MESRSVEFGEVVYAAQAYCALIEEGAPGESSWMEGLFQSLPRLHAAIARLQVCTGICPLADSIDMDERFALYTRLRQGLGERDGYWLEFDADHALNPIHMSGSLADDLTDIYCDLKPGLTLLSERQLVPVLGYWQVSFERHWGQHLVDAERHLYALKVGHRFDA